MGGRQNISIYFIFKILLVGISLYSYLPAYSEPWLGTRFTQNCTACHSGGRLNVPQKEQRCTTSCQACHVNPSGGGLRNAYGQWNQQRWLKSFHTRGSIRTDKPVPLPPKDQDFIRRSAENFLDKSIMPMHETAQNSSDEIVDALGASRNPAQVKRSTESSVKGKYFWGFPSSEIEYGPSVDTSYLTTAANESIFLSRIPDEDPYFLDKEFVTVGMDFKYVYRVIDGEYAGVEVTKDEKNETYISQVDIGVRFRPFREKLSFVFEPRFYNYPDGESFENAFTNGAIVRSAYALLDNMPYNSHLMFGLYTPMFGYSHPDENTNANRLYSHNIDGVKTIGAMNFNYFKGLGAGFSTRYAFFNMHYIQPTNEEAANAGSDTLDSKESGLVGTIGYRGVKNSLSSWLSYWSTKNDDLRRQRTMYSWTSGFQYRRLITHLEALSVENYDLDTEFKNSGMTYTLDSRFRMWRETYLQLYYSTSNTALDLTKGSANESMYGIKSYIFTGLDLELLFINRQEEKESAPEAPTNSTVTQLLLHYYF
jgi:hypothetical protein